MVERMFSDFYNVVSGEGQQTLSAGASGAWKNEQQSFSCGVRPKALTIGMELNHYF